MSTRKSFEELELRDDFMFGKIMRNSEHCKKFLEIILGMSISKLEYPETQKIVDLSYDSKGIRLDVAVSDDNNNTYTIEMQAINRDDLAKRCRYYRAVTDLSLLEKGVFYNELPNNIVIFVCTFDIYKKKRYIYSFKNICVEDNDIMMNDGTLNVFVNTKGRVGNVSNEMKALLKYIDKGIVTSSYTEELARAVMRAKNNKEWEREYMKLELELKERFMEGEKRGEKHGADKIKTLVRLLIADGRTDELKHLDENSEKLLEEYGL